jgi:tRNA(His) guanylyltransferase
MSSTLATQRPADRLKALERQYRTVLPERSYAVIRVDGKGFSRYTRGLHRPFDAKFSADMQETALFLCENVEGARAAYTQSDEISVIISDLSGPRTQRWFGGQVQKIVSTTAALATAKFNRLRPEIDELAVFDGRTHHLDGQESVLEYLQWRQADAIRNSVGMLASHHFKHKELDGVSVPERKVMLAKRGIRWEDLVSEFRQGSYVVREQRNRTVSFVDGRDGARKSIETVGMEWTVKAAPAFDAGIFASWR